MTEEISKEDHDWLDALSGKSSASVDPFVAAQASAVRKAMLARREAIEANANSVGTSGLNEIRTRLQREGLMEFAESSSRKKGLWSRVMEITGIGSSGRMRATPIWGVAAAIMLAVLVTFQVYGPQSDEASIYRGNPNATTLIVENPEMHVSEIVAEIGALSSDSVETTRLKDGRIQLKIKDSPRVQDYLLDQGIEAMPVDGIIRIDVVQNRK